MINSSRIERIRHLMVLSVIYLWVGIGLVTLPLNRGEAARIPEICDCQLPDVPAEDSITLIENVVYNTVQGEDLTLDIAAPKQCASKQRCPVVIVLHGGAFAIGDKATGGGTAQRRAILQLAGLGYIGISANYRLSRPWKNHFPAAVQDVRCLVRWVRVNDKRYGFDRDRIMISGVSAGAGLASTVAVMDDNTTINGVNIDEYDGYQCAADRPRGPKVSSRVKAALVYYGPSDFTIPLYEWNEVAPLIVNYLGGFPKLVPFQARQASPLFHVDRTIPPMLFLHGEVDDTVPFSQSVAMFEALEAVQVPTNLIAVHEVGHSFLMFDPDYFKLPDSSDDLSQIPMCTGDETDGDRCLIETDMGLIIKMVGVLRCSSCSALNFIHTYLDYLEDVQPSK